MKDSSLLEFDALLAAFGDLYETAIGYSDQPPDEDLQTLIGKLLAKQLSEDEIHSLMTRLRHDSSGIAYLASKLRKPSSASKDLSDG